MASCSICSAVGHRKVVDGYLEEGVSGAGVSRAMAEMGFTMTADVINRHKQHYQPPPERPKYTRKADFAVLVRDKAVEQLSSGELDLRDKGTVAGINAGLKGQAILDKRDERKVKGGNADVLVALLRLLEGEAPPPPRLLDDGRTIEGEAVEVG